MTPGFKPFTIHDLWDQNVFYFFTFIIDLTISLSWRHPTVHATPYFQMQPFSAVRSFAPGSNCDHARLFAVLYSSLIIRQLFAGTFWNNCFIPKRFFDCHYPSKNGNNPFLKTHGLRPLSSRITVRASMLIIIHFGVSRWLSLQISTSDPLKRNSRMILFSLVVVNIYCVSFIPGSCFSPFPHSFHAHTQAP